MLITVSNNLQIEDVSPEFEEWCKKNLVLINPEYTKKERMGFWVGNTPKFIHLFEKRGNTYALPYGCMSMFPQTIRQQSYYFDNIGKRETVEYNAEIPLYDYQREAVNEMYSYGYGILQSPAGSGKTQMGIALAVKHKCKTLWIAHTKDLVQQSKERAEQYIDKSLIGTITEGKVNIGKGITFATIQTMAKLDISQIKDYWDCIIVDEAHRVSGTPTSVTQYMKVLNNLSAHHKYGLSATVHRADGMIQATYALLGRVMYNVPDEAVNGRIMQVGIKTIFTGTENSRECMNSDGTLNYTKLINYLADNEVRNELIAKIIGYENRPSLVLSDRLGHLENIYNHLPKELQKQSVMISGKMNTKKGKIQREQVLSQMRSGEKKILFATYSLAKEGLDIPRLERLYLTTPQKDYAVVTQSIGRIARISEGKAEPVAYDFVDDIPYCKRAYSKRRGIYRKNRCYEVN